MNIMNTPNSEDWKTEVELILAPDEGFGGTLTKEYSETIIEFIEKVIASERSKVDTAWRKRIETISDESEWECPEHGKEYVIAPPLCPECNQCLEVNIPLAKLRSSLLSEDTK